ncbi:MAG: Zn-ribbon domain-containing OB-fold protein [Promethearchaeota archaeon]
MSFEDSVPLFWRRIASHYRLVGTQCINPDCAKIFFPPRHLCPDCSLETEENVNLSGRGQVVSYTIIYTAPSGKELQAPYCMAIIELEEGIPITAQITGIDPVEVFMGMQVKAAFRKHGSFSKSGLLHYGFKFVPADYPRKT